MKRAGKGLWIATLLALIGTGVVLFLVSGGPYYRGRPVGQWAIDYSQKLYPAGTSPLSPSQRGLEALRGMGPQKAATALVRALTWSDSKLYERYRLFHPRFPVWYQSRFPLRLTHPQRVTLVLGSTEFFDPDYQKALIPFLIAYLQQPDTSDQVAACQLLANMPAAASPALPALRRLSSSSDLPVSQAAQAAISRIRSEQEASG